MQRGEMKMEYGRINEHAFTEGCTAIGGKVDKSELGKTIVCKKGSNKMKLEKGWNPEVILDTEGGKAFLQKPTEIDVIKNSLSVWDDEGNGLKLGEMK